MIVARLASAKSATQSRVNGTGAAGQDKQAGGVRVELLVVEGCPNEAPARALLKTVLDEFGLGSPIKTTIVRSQADAERLAFVGSPTLLVNGADPFAGGTVPALACRVYPTSTGSAGLPSIAELRKAFEAAT